ncbi:MULTISPECIES: nucleotidyltransferase family protein [unclassified Moorena]|nr:MULTISPECIES: nucleotidyltransferase family protein [unclassified Moorena]NEO18319.1 nucleotidyltransferase family protein [Moorena sp. SIO4A5]NEP21914.1 nucleotidyltransferase family protein [Moorena sp. SIO3I6]NEQ57410.1 nucleotidyltransferase family protein [Moorena sp. SIO4A1]
MKITHSQLKPTESNIAIIILAAGASTRMGKPKQLLPYQGCSLLRHTIEKAMASVCKPVVVVLGANAQQIYSEVNQPSVTVVENPDWNLGMGSSIRSGILSLGSCYETIDAAVITVCDQPFISPEIINHLVAAYHATGKPIVACQYADTLGVPVLFKHRFFSELATLDETVGAKKIINKYYNEVFSISFPLGVIDIDTPRDYQKLEKNQEGQELRSFI